MMITVYLAGPITIPSPKQNVIEAIRVADELLDLGFAPFVPQLSVLWEEHGKYRDSLDYGEGYEMWMRYDLGWLRRCDALLRLPGFSLGADREVRFAIEEEIPVFRSIVSLRRHRRHFETGVYGK